MIKREEIIDYFRFYCENYIDLLSKTRKSEREKVINKYFYKYYKNIIESSGKLIKEVGLNNPFSISVMYEYLLWNGYFSKDKKLEFNMTDRKVVMGALGADIMRGKSVCLNNASMLTDIYNELGIEAYTMGCTIDASQSLKNMEYKLDIERESAKIKLKDRFFSKVIDILHLGYFGNHAITCFKFNEMYSFSDPTNLAFLNLIDMTKLNYVGSEMNAKVKAWLMVTLHEISYESFKEIMMKFFVFSDTKLLDVEKVRGFSENTMGICNNNLKLFDDFHSEISNDIDVVCKTLKKD